MSTAPSAHAPDAALGIVVNFFVSSDNPATIGLVVATTEVGLRLLVLNPAVDAVLLVDGEVIGRGHNRRVQQGSAILHAEMDALENAGRLPAST